MGVLRGSGGGSPGKLQWLKESLKLTCKAQALSRNILHSITELCRLLMVVAWTEL